MVWYRPVKAEIDMLETLGNSGWNWNALEPVCFLCLEIKKYLLMFL